MASRKPKVLLLENIHATGRDYFLQQGYEVESMRSALVGEELIQKVQGVDLLGIRSKTHLTADFFEKVGNLVGVGCFCVGTNQVDLKAAKKAGVAVFNAPFSNTRSVAEMVLGEIIMLARQLGSRNNEMHQKRWNKTSEDCFEVRGKTLGIVGYGNIGTQLSALAEGIGMRVIFYDVVSKLIMGNAQPQPTLQALLEESDFVSFHVPETPLTKDMVGAEEIRMMKEGSYLINASRGTVVDVMALAEALRSGHLKGAALDVFPTEPERNQAEFVNPLIELSNVILTPHIGGATEEAQSNIGREVATTLVRFSETGSTMRSVNFPSVDAPLPPGPQKVHRLINFHQNLPGVLKDINTIVSNEGLNIQGQNLATDPEVGYLVMDFDRPISQTAIDQIQKLPHSIRTRQLE